MGESYYLGDNPAFVGHSPQAVYEQLWYQERTRRLRIRGLITVAALAIGARFLPGGLGLVFAIVAGGADAGYHWWRHSSTAVWRKGRRGDRRMAKILRWTMEPRGYRVLHYRTVPGKGTVDQLVVGPTGVWLIHNEAWAPDTEVTMYAGRLFIGKSTGARMAVALRERARAVGELLTRELGAEIEPVPLVAAHGGRLPRGALVAEGLVVLRPHRLLRWIARRRDVRYTGRQIEAIAAAAVRVLPIGGRMFPPKL
ncbi:MAG TPA: nuclease-related domain-containing protein [Streptosporangiaceae bacterium]